MKRHETTQVTHQRTLRSNVVARRGVARDKAGVDVRRRIAVGSWGEANARVLVREHIGEAILTNLIKGENEERERGERERERERERARERTEEEEEEKGVGRYSTEAKMSESDSTPALTSYSND